MPFAYDLTGPRTLTKAEYEDAALGPRDVRLQSVISGISHGTELNLYRGTSPFAEKHMDPEHRLFVANEAPGQPTTRLGYEMVSRIVEVGSEVDRVRVSELVHTATPHQPTTIVNLDANDKLDIPMQVLPQSVSPREGVFAALVGVALAAIHDAQIKVGDYVTVYGLGTIGLIVSQLARLNGASQIIAVDPIARRRDMALQLGVDRAVDPSQEDPAHVVKFESGMPGADVVIESSGHYRALQDALRSVHMAGTVVTLGYYQGGATAVNLGEEWHHNRLTLVSSMGVWNCPSRFAPMWDRRRVSRTALELLDKDLVQVEDLITHSLPYEKLPEAYQLIDERPEETIKVVIEYD